MSVIIDAEISLREHVYKYFQTPRLHLFGNIDPPLVTTVTTPCLHCGMYTQVQPMFILLVSYISGRKSLLRSPKEA